MRSRVRPRRSGGGKGADRKAAGFPYSGGDAVSVMKYEQPTTPVFFCTRGKGCVVELTSDDRQFVSWNGSRLLKDSANPRVEVTLTAAVSSAA